MGGEISIIGGADGPTAVFLAGKLGLSWINLCGLMFVIELLIPNVLYVLRYRGQENRCENKLMNILEQVGRYGCMLLMVFGINILELRFLHSDAFIAYFYGNSFLMIIYWVTWFLYFRKQTYGKQITLAVLPTLMFLLSGTTLRHPLLVVFGVIFGVGHIYVTSQNRVD